MIYKEGIALANKKEESYLKDFVTEVSLKMDIFLKNNDMKIRKSSWEKLSSNNKFIEPLKIEIEINDNFNFYSYLSSLSEKNIITLKKLKIEWFLSGFDGNLIILNLYFDGELDNYEFYDTSLKELINIMESFSMYTVPLCKNTMKRYAQYLEDTCMPVRCIDFDHNKCFKNINIKGYFKKIVDFLKANDFEIIQLNSGYIDSNPLRGFLDVNMYLDVYHDDFQIINLFNYLSKNSSIGEIYTDNSLIYFNFIKANDKDVLSINIIPPYYILNKDLDIIWEKFYSILVKFFNFEYNYKYPNYIFDSYDLYSEEYLEQFIDRFSKEWVYELPNINAQKLDFSNIDKSLISIVEKFYSYGIHTGYSCSGFSQEHGGKFSLGYLTIIIENEVCYELFKYLKQHLSNCTVSLKGGTFAEICIRPDITSALGIEKYDECNRNMWNDIETNLVSFFSEIK